MMIQPFQALCLLPDGDKFLLFVRYKDRRTETAKIRPMRKALGVEQAAEMIEASGSSRLVRAPGKGYLVAAGRHFLKADGKEAKAFADANGVKFKRRSTGDGR